ncbi:MAG: ABC transporter permease [Cyclobacteriaceae bacterium]
MNVISLELYKISRSKGFYITLGIFFLLQIVALLDFADGFLSSIQVDGQQLPLMQVVQFPKIWEYFGYFGRYFNILLALLVISQVAQEYQYKTLRQHLIEGMSRLQFIGSKMVTVTLLSLASTLLLFVIILIAGFKNTEGADFSTAMDGAAIMPVFFLQTFTYLSMAMFMAILVRKSYLGLILFLLYGVIAEPIIAYYLPDPLGDFLPIQAIGDIIYNPVKEVFGQAAESPIDYTAAVVTGVYAVLFIFGSLALLYKRDV